MRGKFCSLRKQADSRSLAEISSVEIQTNRPLSSRNLRTRVGTYRFSTQLSRHLLAIFSLATACPLLSIVIRIHGVTLLSVTLLQRMQKLLSCCERIKSKSRYTCYCKLCINLHISETSVILRCCPMYLRYHLVPSIVPKRGTAEYIYERMRMKHRKEVGSCTIVARKFQLFQCVGEYRYK